MKGFQQRVSIAHPTLNPEKKSCMNIMQDFLYSDVCINNCPFGFLPHAFWDALNYRFF
jgi:hypothetical protein